MDTSEPAAVHLGRSDGGLVELVLAGAKRNALTPDLLAALDLAIDGLRELDPAVLIVRSDPADAFMVGGDLDLLLGWAEAGSLAREWGRFAAEAGRVFGRLRDLSAVKLAAVEGAAVGGGLELALACDLRIGATAAVCAFPEVRFGVYPSAGTMERLVAAVGEGAGLRLVLGGRFMGAEEALAEGLLDEVVVPGAAVQRAREIGAEMVGAQPDQVRAVRSEIRSGFVAEEVAERMAELIDAVSEEEMVARIRAALRT